MLWPIVLPIKVTLFLMLAIIVIATLAAPLVRVRRMMAFLTVLSLAIICFVPACTAIMMKIDEKRFGEFQYATTNDIFDVHAARYLPPTATKIRTWQALHGIRATFEIDEPALIDYIQSRWDVWGDSAVNRGEDWRLESNHLKGTIDYMFQDLDWDLPDPDVVFSGPAAANGTGFQIWYDRGSQTAILWGGYW